MKRLIYTLTAVWLLAGCGRSGSGPAATAVPTRPHVQNPAATTQLPLPQTAIANDEIPQLLQSLLASGSSSSLEGLNHIKQSGDTRFIAVLLELYRARQIGLIRQLNDAALEDALHSLSGQRFGSDWRAWIEWYGATDLEPPPGFTSWKGELLAGIDPAFADLLQDDLPARIRIEEILWGGVSLDGIPALENPAMLPAAEADYLDPWDVVFGISLNGDARAYPLRILDWHEMVNDVVGGAPVSLAYCTLCGAAIAYDGRSQDAAGNPITYTFGSSGFLYRSNKLMYDRQTRTLWNQLTGEPVLGELAASAIRLQLLPIVLTTWADWQAQHPDTQVVDRNTGHGREYAPGAAYGDYFGNHEAYQDGLMFPVWLQDERLDNKEYIYALRLDGVSKAYPVTALVEGGVVNDVVGETAVTLIAPGDILTVAGQNRRVGDITYTAGAQIRAYARGAHTFTPGVGATAVVDAAGNTWQVTEAALIGPGGETLPRINGHLAYWFGWYAFYPDTLLYGGS